MYKKPYDPTSREVGRDWPARAESMIGLSRMDNIQHCVQAVLSATSPGDLIETGVWRGGATIFMRAKLEADGDTDRTVWVADSFEGLPPPDAALSGRRRRQSAHPDRPRVGADQVRHNFERYGLLDEQVRFLVGWFKDSLPTAPIEQLSLVRLDGDMYESTFQAIEALYPKLSPGGFCSSTTSGATSHSPVSRHDYRDANGIAEEIIDVDGFGAYWRRRDSNAARNRPGRPSPPDVTRAAHLTTAPGVGGPWPDDRATQPQPRCWAPAARPASEPDRRRMHRATGLGSFSSSVVICTVRRSR